MSMAMQMQRKTLVLLLLSIFLLSGGVGSIWAGTVLQTRYKNDGETISAELEQAMIDNNTMEIQALQYKERRNVLNKIGANILYTLGGILIFGVLMIGMALFLDHWLTAASEKSSRARIMEIVKMIVKKK